MRRLLVVGVELMGVPTLGPQVRLELEQSAVWEVDNHWWSLAPSALRPKFSVINQLLAGVVLEPYEYVIVADDDIWLPPEFTDRFLSLMERHDLALAQPARTHNSVIHHPIVEQRDGLAVRETRFVEIGPLFAMRADAARLLVPFDESSPMGWGYDYVWPCVMAAAGLKMGIVDATPVRHTFRVAVSGYDPNEAAMQMGEYLQTHAHLAPRDAYTVLAEHR